MAPAEGGSLARISQTPMMAEVAGLELSVQAVMAIAAMAVAAAELAVKVQVLAAPAAATFWD